MAIPTYVPQAAESLRNAAASATPIVPLRDTYPSLDLAGAYAIQNTNTEHRLATGRRITGCKIGLTSPAVQRQLGVDQPDFGMLFDDMGQLQGVPIPMSSLLQPKIEAEVAFVLGRNLDMPNPSITEVMRAVEFALPALEIVGSRIRNWDIRLVDTVADNASSNAYVIGNTPRRLHELDLGNSRMTMTRNKEQVSSGVGSACLGHPLNALLWLARAMSQLGAPLREGYLILSGALGPLAAVIPGECYRAEIEGLGTVTAAFESL